MTQSEFNLLAKILKSKDPILSGVSLILFDGLTNADAARAVNTSPQSLHRATKRFLELYREIKEAFES